MNWDRTFQNRYFKRLHLAQPVPQAKKNDADVTFNFFLLKMLTQEGNTGSFQWQENVKVQIMEKRKKYKDWTRGENMEKDKDLGKLLLSLLLEFALSHSP